MQLSKNVVRGLVHNLGQHLLKPFPFPFLTSYTSWLCQGFSSPPQVPVTSGAACTHAFPGSFLPPSSHSSTRRPDLPPRLLCISLWLVCQEAFHSKREPGKGLTTIFPLSFILPGSVSLLPNSLMSHYFFCWN